MAKKKTRRVSSESDAAEAGKQDGAATPDTVEDMFDEWKHLKAFRVKVRERLVSYKQKAANGPRELRRFLNDLDKLTA